MKKKIIFLFLVLPILAAHGQEKWSIDSIAKYLEFRYAPPKGFTQTFGELHFKTPDRPRGSRGHKAQWTSKDKECIVFLDDGGISNGISTGFYSKINKSRTGIHDTSYNRIGNYLGITRGTISPSEMEELEKVIKRWPEKKAKEWFNAHHVIEYPDAEEDAIYEGGYCVKRSLCIIKWERYIEINFLVTEKGYKNLDKYMEGMKKAFWFND